LVINFNYTVFELSLMLASLVPVQGLDEEGREIVRVKFHDVSFQRVEAPLAFSDLHIVGCAFLFDVAFLDYRVEQGALDEDSKQGVEE
jgi:hypothetical protein